MEINDKTTLIVVKATSHYNLDSLITLIPATTT